MQKPFTDRVVGEAFQIDVGGGNWVDVVKTAHDSALKLNGYVIGVSAWTKTRVSHDAGKESDLPEWLRPL